MKYYIYHCRNNLIMAKRKVKTGAKTKPFLEKKSQVSFYVKNDTIKKNGGRIAVVEKCKTLLEDGD